MTTITSHDGRDHDERVQGMGAVLTAVAVLTGLLVGATLLVSQLVDVVLWAFAGR